MSRRACDCSDVSLNFRLTRLSRCNGRTWTPLPSGVTIVTSPHRHVFVPGAETEGRHVATGAKEGTISGYSGASGGPGLGVSITGDGATVAGANVAWG